MKNLPPAIDIILFHAIVLKGAMKIKHKYLTISAISTLIILYSLNLAAIETHTLAPRSFQADLPKIEELIAAISPEEFQKMRQAKPRLLIRILEEITALGINPKTKKLLCLELFQEIDIKYLQRLLEEIPEVLPKILAPIREMGYSQKLQELRVLPFFREIGIENIGPLMIIEPGFLASSLTRLSELGLNEQSDQLAVTEITRKLKGLLSLADHIGAAFIHDCRTFAVSLDTIRQMGADEATGELTAIAILREIDNEIVMAKGLGAVWEENSMELSLSLQYLQELVQNGIDIFSVLAELKKEENIQNCLGAAWVKHPYFFLATLALIHQLGRDESGELHVWNFFHDIGTEHIARSWRSQPAAFAEIIRIIHSTDYLQELCRRLGPGFIREALTERTEDLCQALKKYENQLVREKGETVYDEQALGLDWIACLRQLDNLLNLPAVRELIRQLPPELALNLRLEAVVLLSKLYTAGDISKLLIDKYNNILKHLLVYNRYLQTIGLEIEIALENEETFPLAEASLVCSLLGISRGKDLSVLLEYTTPPLRHYSYGEPYYRLFEETGFIPDSGICSLHLSFPYRKIWGRKKLSGNLDLLALLACLLYSPDERLLPPHSGAINRIIEIKEDTAAPSGEITGWREKMVRIEIRALAFQKRQNHYRQAARAINLLYSCFFCANKDAGKRDIIERQLAAVWEEFLNRAKQLLDPHTEKLLPFMLQFNRDESAPQCLEIIKNLRADHPGLIGDLNDLVNKQLAAVEEILAAPEVYDHALIAHYEKTLPRLINYIRNQHWPLRAFLELFQRIGAGQIGKMTTPPQIPPISRRTG